MANYSLILQLIANDKEFQKGFARAGVALDNHANKVKKAGNDYNKTQQSLRKLTDVARNAALSFGAGSKQFKEASSAATAYKRKLDGVNAAMQKAGLMSKKMGSSGGGLGSSIIGVAAKRIIPLAILNVAIKGMKQLVTVFADFEAILSEVEGVSGATSSEIGVLSDQAKYLGRTTQRTATDVLKLQVELSKLGFTAKEISQATEAVLALSVATRTDLGEAAKVVASTIKAYHLAASDAQRVTDVMSKAFTSSALNMEKFSTGMAILAPAAYTAGINIEGATAALGVLADNGLDASMAGTSLRNIFLELSMKGLDLDDVLNEIATSSNKAATAQLYFQKRSASAAIILAGNQEALVDLTAKTFMAEDATMSLAETMSNNLKGDVELLKSAWQGFILAIEDGDGAINHMIRGSLSGLSKLLTYLAYTVGGFQNKGKIIGFNIFSEKQLEIGKEIKKEIGDFSDIYAEFVAKAKEDEMGYSEFVKKSGELRTKYKEEETDAKIKAYGEELKAAIEVKNTLTDIAFEDNELSRNEAFGLDKQSELIRLLRIELELLKERKLFAYTPDIDGVGDGGDRVSNIDMRVDPVVATSVEKTRSELERLMDLLSELKTHQKDVTNTREEWAKWQKEIDVTQQSINDLKAVFEDWDMSSIFTTDIARVAEMEKVAAEWESFYNTMKQMALDFAVDMAATGISDVFEVMANKDSDALDNYGMKVLQSFGDFLVQMGSMMIAYGVAQGALLASATTGNFVGVIAAGGAMVAVGAAMSGFAKGNLAKAASGGGAGDTSGAVSQQACPVMEGFSRYAADGMGSSSRSGGTSAGDNEVVFKIEGDSLVGVLNKSMKRQNSLY